MATPTVQQKGHLGAAGGGNGIQQLAKGTAVATAGAAAPALQQPMFRYWVDEVLWSQGRLATITIEEVLDQMGGQRTGGPPKPAHKVALSGIDQSLRDQLQQARLADQHQQQTGPGLLGSLPAVTGVTVPLSRSSSEAVSSSRTSSASSLSSASAANDLASAAAEQMPLQPIAAGVQPSAAAGAGTTGQDTSSGTAAVASAAAAGSSSEDLASAAGDPSSSQSLGATKRPDDHLLGYRHVRQWDLLWTKSVYAIRAARQLQQGQVVSAIAGLNCLSMKKRMVQTLRMALGADAFQIVPLSFCVPEDLPAWQSWLSSPQGAAADTGLWMLKTGQDAGKGLRLVRTQHALQVAVRPPKNPSKPQNHIKVAQQYITNPLLVQGRKFHLRLWLLVTAHQPLRAYLHSQGLVLFSSEPYDIRHPFEGVGVKPSVSHVTNYARNEDTWVWELQQLQQQLGKQRWQRLWQQMKHSSALTAAAVLGPLRAAHRWLQPSVGNYGFQMLGLDYLIDESLHPWLLEVNSAPSIMAVHSDPAACNLIKDTKQAMLRDMLAMVEHRMQSSSSSSSHNDGSSNSGSRAAPSWQEELAAEMTNRGGFEPLMGLFPVGRDAGSSSSGAGGIGGRSNSNIPWQEVDLQLQRVLQQQYPHA